MKKKYIWKTPEEINQEVAKRFTKIRKIKKINQQQLSDLSGVSYGSIKRFEQSGNISLLSLTKLCMALNMEDEIDDLFKEVPFNSIDEVLNADR